MSCHGDCQQGRTCDCAAMGYTLSFTEAALLSLIVVACTGLCAYLIVVFFTFMGV